MDEPAWAETLEAAITVCDADGTIVAMNARSAATFARQGGRGLVGKNALGCHPEPARTTLAALLEAGRANVYTIEKNGVRKLIAQLPYTEHGAFAGLVEISIELPAEMPHFVRG